MCASVHSCSLSRLAVFLMLFSLNKFEDTQQNCLDVRKHFFLISKCVFPNISTICNSCKDPIFWQCFSLLSVWNHNSPLWWRIPYICIDSEKACATRQWRRNSFYFVLLWRPVLGHAEEDINHHYSLVLIRCILGDKED